MQGFTTVRRGDAAHAGVSVQIIDALRDILVGGGRQDVLRVADRLAQPFADEVVGQHVIQRVPGEAVVQRRQVVVSLECQIASRPRRVVADNGGALGLVTGWVLGKIRR
jgi:hypothetical protein